MAATTCLRCPVIEFKKGMRWHHGPDVICPWCGAKLVVEDSDDFERAGGPFVREDRYEMECPVCENAMSVYVCFEPTYDMFPMKVEYGH